jgi:predicted TIM-barrel fold metal-dependent hydrolase
MRIGRRFVALADLPVHAPQLAIQELRRCVRELGFVGAMFTRSIGGSGKFLDAPEFDDLLSEFEELDVPLYLHPGIAPKPVMDTYYNIQDNPGVSATLGGMGWGWHEAAIHALRLCVSGTLDKHPRLKVVIGHQGEMMPMMIQRFDAMFDQRIFGFKRSVGEMLRSQVWITTSGLFTIPPTLIGMQTKCSSQMTILSLIQRGCLTLSALLGTL